MMLSICTVRQPVRVIRCNSPSFLTAFHGGTPPFGHSINLPTRSSESRQEFSQADSPTKMAAHIFSLYLYHVGHFKDILNALTHLIILHYIQLLYSSHKLMHCTVLLCMQYNVKLCSLSSWFAKEANVTNNNNDWPMRNGTAISAASQEIMPRSR